MFKTPKVEWDEIQKAWQMANRYRHSRYLGDVLPPFQDIPVCSPDNGLRLDYDILDWWPRREVSKRVRMIEEKGRFGIEWSTNKGTLHTAHLFEEAKDDPELTVAIWVGATLKDLHDRLPDSWRGEPYGLIEGMEMALYRKLPPQEGVWWHHASREALPVRIPSFVEVMRPTEVGHVVEVAMARANEVRADWIIALVSHAERTLHAVGG